MTAYSITKALVVALLALAPLTLVAAKPSWITMPYLATWETGINLATLPWDDMTHVAEAFALPGYNGAMPTMAAPGARANLVSTAHANGTRAVLSIGGASADNAAWSSSASAAYRATFIANIMTLMANGGYDGVDIDWEFPGAADRANFTALMQGLYDAMHNPANPNYKGLAFDGEDRELSFYISPGYFVCGVDWNVMGNYCDFAVLPGYDQCSGGFEGPIGGNYPGTDCAGTSYQVTVSGNMTKLTGGGANYSFPRNKLVLGMPFYNCAGTRLETTTASGSHSSFNATTMESTWSNGATVNDSTAFCAKINWALGQGFQGIAMWELSQAYPRNGTAEVGRVWDVIGGKNACITAANTPTRTPVPGSPTRSPTPTTSPTPWVRAVPGRVQAEDFNAAYDSTVGNAGGAAYRTGNVDIEASTDTGLGYNIGYTVAGEWLDYLVQAGGGGTFDLSLRLASQGPGPLTLRILVNGSPAGADINVPVSGGWQTWIDVAGPDLTLNAGLNTIRVQFVTGEINFNYFDVLASSTPTFTPSRTPSNSPTRTRTPSPSPSATRTSTPSASSSRTASPSQTRTGSPTVSGTASPSRTASTTVTDGPSPTQTWTPTVSGTASPSRTASTTVTDGPSPTQTWTPTASGTASPSRTASSTATDGPSPTQTRTLTASVTPSSSPTESRTATAGPSPTQTWTPTASATPSASPTVTRTATPSATPSASPTGGVVASSTATPAATSVPPVNESDPDVEQVVVAPNPVTDGRLRLHALLKGDADRLRLKVYSRAFVLLTVMEFGPQRAGWGQAHGLLPEDAAQGAYFAELSAERGGKAGKSRACKFVVLKRR